MSAESLLPANPRGKAEPFQIVTRDELPALEAEAERRGLVLDRWQPIDGDEDTIAARIVCRTERDRARACRFLGL